MAAAAALRDTAHRHITFSPKVFIPLTRLCRDRCAPLAALQRCRYLLAALLNECGWRAAGVHGGLSGCS